LGGIGFQDAGDETLIIVADDLVGAGQPGAVQILSHGQGKVHFFKVGLFDSQNSNGLLFENLLQLGDKCIKVGMAVQQIFTEMLPGQPASLNKDGIRRTMTLIRLIEKPWISYKSRRLYRPQDCL
jgi:hypothetical protein